MASLRKMPLISNQQPYPEDMPDPAQEAFLRSHEAWRGHPTAPGLNEEQIVRTGAPSPGNGVPGRPRVQPTPGSQGPGLPGPTPTGPLQPGVFYDNPEGEDLGRPQFGPAGF